MKGSPVGVDVRRVVELGITPSVTTGILDNAGGTGQVGAGVAEAPLSIFVNALLALDHSSATTVRGPVIHSPGPA